MCLLTYLSDYMVYTRGSREDYDRYARISGDEGWSWNKMLPYFRKVGPLQQDLSKMLKILFL